MSAARRPPRTLPRFSRSLYLRFPVALLCASALNAPALAANEGLIAATSSATIAISVSVRPSPVLTRVSVAMVTSGRNGTLRVSAECGRDAAREAPLGFDALATLSAPQTSASVGERLALAAVQTPEFLLAGDCLNADTLAPAAIGMTSSAQTGADLTLIIAPR